MGIHEIHGYWNKMIIECGPLHDKRTFELTVPAGKKVGVFVSGGIDSALLYYLVLKESQTISAHEYIKPIIIHRKEGSRYYARPIIEKVNVLCDYHATPVRLGNTTLSEPEQVKNAVTQAFRFPPYFETVYVGVITNRPEHMIGFDPIIIEPHDQVITPFKNLEKSHIIHMYYQLRIEHLLQHTHSCDQHETVPCGSCNGCRERAWGFDQLGLIDPLNTL